MHDLIIIGSGPAGLAAAIYAQRARLNTLVVEKAMVSGGQVLTTYEVDNYPGLPGMGGYDLGMKLREHADALGAVFAEDEVERIYLNFSDPWPKDRHAKRRLTSDRFLAVYDKILQPDGIIEFKTDNQDLFRYSLESIPEAGWQVTSHTFDLHHSDMAEGNVMTEYETKFSAEGKPICKLTACRDKKNTACIY